MEQKSLIIISFSYKDNSFRPLPSIVIDIYRIYTLFSNFDNIYIISDINRSVTDNLQLQNSIAKNEIPANVYDFLTNSIEFNYLFYKYKDMDTFNTVIRKIKTQKNIIYFSGHSSNGYFLLPKKDKIDMILFRNLWTKNSNAETLFILDCCDSRGLGLPFKIDKNNIPRNTNFKNYINNNIICISSSQIDERSILTNNKGSLFTRSLFELVNSEVKISKKLNLLQKELYNISNNESTCNITVSKLNIIRLWYWVLGNKNLDITYANNHIIILNN